MRIPVCATAMFLMALLATSSFASPPSSRSEAARDAGFFDSLGVQFEQARQNIEQAGQNIGSRASDLVDRAMGFMGVRYQRGGNSAQTGFDCSGFVRAIYEQSIGLLLPRSAAQQAAATETITEADLKPGDLVFYNTMRRAFSHVGIYIGDGKFIHSPSIGGSVRVEDMRQSYWEKRFDGARRVAPGLTGAALGGAALGGAALAADPAPQAPSH